MTGPIGFVGLGNMGSPMARRLIGAGEDLVVFDLDATACAQLADAGATVASSPRDVGDRARTVLVSLPTPAIVEAVLLGPDGVGSGAAVKRIVDLSTTGTTAARSIAAQLSQRGVDYLDAPVSGGVPGAERGTLSLMLSGSPKHREAIAATLAPLGKVFQVGSEPGDGQSMKLLNNYLNATALASSSEALVFGVKAGLSADVMIDVLNASSGRNSATEDKIPRAVLNGSFSAGFTLGLMCKDLILYRDEVRATGAPSAMVDEMLEHWIAARDALGAETDFTSIIRPMEALAGVGVRSRGEQERS